MVAAVMEILSTSYPLKAKMNLYSTLIFKKGWGFFVLGFLGFFCGGEYSA